MSEFWWGLIWLTLFIPLMFLWGFALWDIFSRHDLRGWAKAVWALAIVFFPIVGLLVYFIARPKDLDTYGYAYGTPYATTPYGSPYYGYGYPYGAPPPPQYQPEYERASGPPPPTARDSETLTRLHEAGDINDQEYNDLKARASEQERGAA